MTAPRFSEADYVKAFQGLLPRGRVWPRDSDAVLTQVLEALAPTFKRQNDACADLLIDCFPATAVHLLPEWESTLALPDPCSDSVQTLEERQASVVQKLTTVGGQSAAYFIALANALGYSGVAIKNFAPFRAGHSKCGDRTGTQAWIFTWLVEAGSLDLTFFKAGQGRAGDALYSITLGALGCEFKKYAPAHTNILFATFTSLSTDDGFKLETDDGKEIIK